jgi:prepilin-type N-terminal cleavage/methylation domain-containing protein
MIARTSIRTGLRTARAGGFSLLEVMLAVTITGVLVASLYAVFNQTQRALRSNVDQVDVLEGGRAAMELITRELADAAASGYFGEINFSAGIPPLWTEANPDSDKLIRRYYHLPRAADYPADLSGFRPSSQGLGPAQVRTNILQEAYWLRRMGNVVQAKSLRVINARNGIGTLARFEYAVTNPPRHRLDLFPTVAVAAATNYSQMLDGVIHLRFLTYDQNGFPIVPLPGNTNLYRGVVRTNEVVAPAETRVQFLSNALPAYVEVELGVLEPTALTRFRAFPADSVFARQFLSNSVGQVHLFRQRVPIRQSSAYYAARP